MIRTRTAATGMMNTVTSAMIGLMDTIMMSTPMIIVMLVMSCVTPWLKLCPSVSMSLVMRESVSPTDVRSKYPMGIRSILAAMSARIW